MKFEFPKRITADKYRIYEETLYDRGKWVKTCYTVKQKISILGIHVWVYLWDSKFNTVGFKTRADAHTKITKIEKYKKRTGWTKVLIDQIRFDQ